VQPHLLFITVNALKGTGTIKGKGTLYVEYNIISATYKLPVVNAWLVSKSPELTVLYRPRYYGIINSFSN